MLHVLVSAAVAGHRIGLGDIDASAKDDHAQEPARRNQKEPTLESRHPATMAAQALGWIDEQTKALIPPVHPATTFIRDPDNQYRAGYSYGRSTNPTFVQPEALLTRLEGGAACLTFASG